MSRHQEVLPMTELNLHRAKLIAPGEDWRHLPNKEIRRPDGTLVAVTMWAYKMCIKHM